MAKKIPYVDPELCAGYEICVGVCPNVFHMNEKSGKAEAYNPEGDTEENIQAAMDACPAHAIRWIEQGQ